MLAEGPLDANGRATLMVPVSDLPELGPQGACKLAAVLDGPGLCSGPKAIFIYPGSEGKGPALIVSQAGRTVRGQIVDASARPTPARVAFVMGRRAPQRFPFTYLQSNARSYADGSFELDLTVEQLESEQGLSIALDAGERGTGIYRDLPVALFLDPTKPPTLAVAGPGVLRGRVVDNAGRPSPGLVLTMQTRGLDHQARALAEASAGAVRRTVRTAKDGSFEVRGLAAALFDVLPPDTGRSAGRLPLNPVPILSDGEALELIYEQKALIVRSASSAPLATTSSGSPRNWPAQRTAVLWAASGIGSEWTPSERHALNTKTFDGGVIYEPEYSPPTNVAVLLIGGAQAPQYREVPLTTGTSTVTFEPAAPAGLGIVRFELAASQGTLDSSNHRLWIEPLDFRFPLLQDNPSYPFKPHLSMQLPAGRYRAVLEGRTKIENQHGTVHGSRTLGRAELEFEVVAGTTLPYSIEVRPGGVLEVTLEGKFDASDREAVLNDKTGWYQPKSDAPADIEAFVADRGAQVLLTLHHPDRNPETLYFLRKFTESGSFNGTHVWPELKLGETAKAEMVPAGDYELVAELPGGRTWRGRVQVREGEELKVSISF